MGKMTYRKLRNYLQACVQKSGYMAPEELPPMPPPYSGLLSLETATEAGRLYDIFFTAGGQRFCAGDIKLNYASAYHPIEVRLYGFEEYGDMEARAALYQLAADTCRKRNMVLEMEKEKTEKRLLEAKTEIGRNNLLLRDIKEELYRHPACGEISPPDPIEVMLLSETEYEAAMDRSPVPEMESYDPWTIKDQWWWLRTPGIKGHVRAVNGGFITTRGIRVDNAGVSVRPALKYAPRRDIQPQDSFSLAGHTWTVISDCLALCDDAIGQHCFRKDPEAKKAEDYEGSDVQQFIDVWAWQNGLPV